MTIEYITDVVCTEFEVDINDVINPCKLHKIAIPRKFIHYFCRKFTLKSYWNIGTKVGKCHESNVSKNCETLIDSFYFKPDLKEKFDKLNNHFKSIRNVES